MTDNRSKPLSKEEFAKRLPPATPDELLGALHDKVHKDIETSKKIAPYPQEYKPDTCITAGELRESGFNIPEHVPDCAWIPRGSLSPEPESLKVTDGGNSTVKIAWAARLTTPFRWVTGTYSITKDTSETHEKPPVS